MNQLWYAVLGAFLSVILGVIFSEPLKNLFSPFLAKLGQKKDGINGVWEATFEYPTNTGKELYTELIEIKSVLGQIIGRIIPHKNNHSRLVTVATKKPVRLRGELRDNLFFTGTWLHPLDRQHYHGAFHLLVSMSGNEMEGIWIGYSDKKKKIEEGKWNWKRI